MNNDYYERRIEFLKSTLKHIKTMSEYCKEEYGLEIFDHFISRADIAIKGEYNE